MLLIPDELFDGGFEMEMMAAIIVLCYHQGTTYPVINHSFLEGVVDVETVYAPLEGWQLLPRAEQIKVVLSSQLATGPRMPANRPQATANASATL